MNKNIDLGTFQWDTNKIEHQVAANTMEMNKFSSMVKVARDQIKEQSKDIALLESKIESERKAQERMTREVQAGTRSQESYNFEIEKSNQNLEQYVTEQIALGKAQSDNIIIVNRAQAATKDLRLENNELNKLLSAGRVELSNNESAYRDLNKELNALKLEAKNLGVEMLLLEKDGKKGTDEYKRLAAQFAETSKKADNLNNEFKALDHSVGDNSRTVGDYKDQIVNAWNEIGNKVKSGDLKGAFDSAKDGVNGLKEGIGGMFKMIAANPWLIVLAGIALFVKEMWEYNAQVRELNKTVEQLANTSGKATDELRKNAQAIQDTYGRDFKESVVELNSLMQDFNISASEAFRIYNEGLAAGGAANSEFGDSIREYGPLFAQAGYSAQDFVNILNAGIDLGVYNDKLPDAIKEASIALKEQTKSTRDALVNAFGATFADDILKKVQSGQMTVADALENISKKAKDANLNQQQLAQLTADVFKGAGEDAGGALVIFDAINRSQETQSENLTDLEKAVIALADKNRELADAKDEAFKSDSAIEFQQTVNNVWKDIQISWYKYLGSISKNTQREIDFLKLIFLNVKDAITSIPQAFSIIMGGLNKDFKQLADIGRAVGNVFANMFNPDALKNAVDSLYSQVNDFTSFTKKSISEVAAMNTNIANKNKAQIAAQRKASTDAAKAQGEAEKLLLGSGNATGSVKDAADKAAADAAKSNSKKVADSQKAAAAAQKAAQEAAKKELELARQNADLTAGIAKTELAEYIANNAAKLDSDKRLNQQRLAEQIKYFDEVQALKLAEITADRDTAIIGKTEAEKEQIRREYAIKETELTNETAAKKAEITKQYSEQTAEDERLRQAIEFQQQLIDLEERQATEWEFRKELALQQRAEDLVNLEIQRADDLISQANYEAQRKLIESSYAAESKQIIKDVDDFKIESRSEVLSGLTNLFGRESALGKIFAAAEITNNTVQQATKAFSQAAVFASNPLTAALAPNAYIQGGIIVATGAAQLAKLVAPKPKAARGMVIRGNSHDYGGVDISTPAGTIEAEGGEPILTKKAFRMFPQLISDINVAGGGVPLFASGGLVPSRTAGVQSSLKINSPAINLSDEAIEAVAAAIYAGSQAGLGDMADNRKIANNANF